jgi:hypothetical protein
MTISTTITRHGSARGWLLALIVAAAATAALALVLWLPPPATHVMPPGDELATDAVDVGIRVTPEVVDFGLIQPNEASERAFTLRNDSNVARTVRGVTTSCGCLTVGWEMATLAPGESREFQARLVAPAVQAAPLRFDISISFGSRAESIDVPVIGETDRIFSIEPILNGEGALAGLHAASLDGEAFEVIQTPWFLLFDQASSSPASSVEFQIEAERSRAIRAAADANPRLVLKHARHGEVRWDWSDPAALPPAPLPMLAPTGGDIELSGDAAAQGAEVVIGLAGPRPADVPRIAVADDPAGDVAFDLLNVETTPGGIIARVLVRNTAARWHGTTITFTYDGRPACAVRLVPPGST